MVVHTDASFYTFFPLFVYIFNLFPVSVLVFMILFKTINSWLRVKRQGILITFSIVMTLTIIFIHFKSPSDTLIAESIFEGIFIQIILLPAAICGIFIWGGLEKDRKATLTIIGIIMLLFLFFYPKPVTYFKKTSFKNPLFMYELFVEASTEWTTKPIRYDDHVKCSCAGVYLGDHFGNYPVNFAVCMGATHSCTTETIDLCPNTPEGENCGITVVGSL
ncbi:hypothetical protein KBD81_03920 [Candidatus Woesebacteria bacterium]|nr:hypothetical protein [Candidatus Woesebacteria bacterium]